MIFFDMNVSHVFLSQITKIKKITDNKLCPSNCLLHFIQYSLQIQYDSLAEIPIFSDQK